MAISFSRPKVRLRPAPPGDASPIFQHSLIGQEIVAQERGSRQLRVGLAGNEAVRTEATRILGLGNGNRTLPCKDVGKQQVTGFDAVQALGTDVAARQRRLVEDSFAEGADAQFRIAAIQVNGLLPTYQRRHLGHRPQRRIGNGIAEAQCQQVFGVALDGIQMRFDLPGFLGQCVEAGDEGLLFGQ